MKSVRIGNKNKSVMIKSYIINFHARLTKSTTEDTIKFAKHILERAITTMPPEYVTSDYISVHLLTEIDIIMEDQQREIDRLKKKLQSINKNNVPF